MTFPRFRRGAALVGAIALGLLGASRARAAGPVEALIAEMSPAERVGQLFIVPFRGQAVEGRAIAQLVDAGIGGVLLERQAGNFGDAPDTPRQVATLANALQARAARRERFVPLWIAIDSEAGTQPGSPLQGGMSPLPSAMALGAAWDPVLAGRVGEVLGRELRAVGVNLWLGPNLDVLDQPRPGSSGDLGARAFGGNPSWVAKLGRAVVGGIHRGSDGHVAVAVGHFPGVGRADRSQTDELPIVESAFEDLQRTELVPFVAVVEPRDNSDHVADAIVTTHVRFRGVQRQIDRPLSLDGTGLAYLRGQMPSLDAWRTGGGLLISPGLGLPGVRRYADSTGGAFNVRRVVREALLAGNDALNLSGFDVPTDPTVTASEVREAIDWLAAAYTEDDNVREAVDGALRRVITRKLGLYPGAASLTAVTVDAETAPAATGLGGDETQAVARAALTLFAPPAAGGGRAPVPSPQVGDRILFVVDAREARDCAECPVQRVLDPDQVRDTCLRTYGPTGSGTRRVASEDDVGVVTARELRGWLAATGRIQAENNPTLLPPLAGERLAEVDRWVDRADWIVFFMRDVRPSEAPGSDAPRLFLQSRLSEPSKQRLVAVAFDAPYGLDATDIARLSAYYAVYSPGEPFVRVAVRAVFGDEVAVGASPVAVPGAGYDLAAQLRPAADQVIEISLVGGRPDAVVARGGRITVRTGEIHDANGHAVPDGTTVTVRGFDPAEDVYLRDVVGQTIDGRATVTMPADRQGDIEITAVLENSLSSAPLVVHVSASVFDAAPNVNGPEPLAITRLPADWSILLLSLTLILLAGVVVFGAGVGPRVPSRVVRLFLLSLACGLAGYLLVLVGGLRVPEGLPDGAGLWPRSWNPAYQAPIVSFLLALLPLAPSAWRAARRWWPAGWRLP
ncbi:MAG: glycoside hydrolase family 3 N-terminal domain-containing protein [Ardenticatenales bacterium]